MDDVSLVSLEYQTPSGPVWATVETDYFTPGKFREVVVIGQCLSAVCDYAAATNKITTYENRHARSGSAAGTVTHIPTPGGEPLHAELEAFLQSLSTREAPLSDGWAGYEAVRVLQAATESAQTGKAVALI